MSIIFNALLRRSANQPKAIIKPPPLIISQQPTNYTGTVGADFQILVVSNGTSYVFYKGSTLISKSTTGVLAFFRANAGDSGSYYCIVTDEYGQSLQSATITVAITENETIPTPDPEPDHQPINGTVIRVNKMVNNKTYNSTALAGKNYLLFRNGYQRFLFPHEFDALSTGGFELHSPLITGDCIIVMLLDDHVIALNQLTGNKAYTNTLLAGKSYAVYRNGYRRLLAAHEFDSKSEGGFELHSPLITGDGVVILVDAAILKNLNGNNRYVNTGLQSLNYTLYHEGLGRFLNENEFDKLAGGGFKLHLPLTLSQRLIVFKL